MLKALENADRVIEVVRGSKDTNEAKEILTKEFELSDIQATAILDMRLSRFTALEGGKLKDEAEELRTKIAEYQRILSSEEEKIRVFKEEIDEMLLKYGDERKTVILEKEKAGLTFEENYVIAVLSSGRVINRKIDKTEGETSKEVIDKVINEVSNTLLPGEELISIQDVKSSNPIAFVTNKGKCYWSLAADLPKGEGKIEIEEDEKIIGTGYKDEGNEDRIFLLTKNGIVKRMTFEDIFYKSQGQTILPLSEGDEVVSAFSDDNPSHLAIYTKKGDLLIFERSQVRVTGTKAKGVEGIDLDEGDEVVGGFIMNSDPYVMTITAGGYVKLVDKEEFPVKKRGQKGIMAVKLGKGDYVASMIPVKVGDAVTVSTAKGRLLKFTVDERRIPVAKRTAMGDPALRIEGDTILKAIKVLYEEEK